MRPTAAPQSAAKRSQSTGCDLYRAILPSAAPENVERRRQNGERNKQKKQKESGEQRKSEGIKGDQKGMRPTATRAAGSDGSRMDFGPYRMLRKLEKAQSKRFKDRFEFFSLNFCHLGERNAHQRRRQHFITAFPKEKERPRSYSRRRQQGEKSDRRPQPPPPPAYSSNCEVLRNSSRMLLRIRSLRRSISFLPKTPPCAI